MKCPWLIGLQVIGWAFVVAVIAWGVALYAVVAFMAFGVIALPWFVLWKLGEIGEKREQEKHPPAPPTVRS